MLDVSSARLIDARGDLPNDEGTKGSTNGKNTTGAMVAYPSRLSKQLVHTRSNHMGLMGASPIIEVEHHTRPHPFTIIKQSFVCYWEQMKTTRSLPVLEPNGYFIRLWNPCVFALTVYAVIALPFDLAFSYWKPPGVYKVFGKVVDLIFLSDMALHFNTAIVHGDHVIYDRKAIALHYAKSWLPLDVGANLPWDWFVGSGGKHRKLVKILKLPKIFRFVRMMRLLKAQTHFIGVGAAFLGIAIFAHYMGCCWVLALLENSCGDDSLDVQCDDVAGTYAEALTVSIAAVSGSDAWTRFIYGAEAGSRIAKFRDGKYLNGWEELLAMAGVVGGYMLLAILFGTVNSAIEHMNARGRKRFNMLQARKTDMRNAKIPWDLQRRVEATYEQTWMFGDWRDGFLRDDTLSLDLRRNLAYHVYGPALRAVPMLSEFSSADLKCLAQKIDSCCYTPGDLIIQAGERAAEMYLVFSGIAQPLDRNGKVLDQVLLKKGDFFGEICFLFPGRRRTASVACIQFCRVMVVKLGVFEELGLEHLLGVIRQTCASRMDYYVMSHTECVLPADFDTEEDGRLGRKGQRLSGLATEEEGDRHASNEQDVSSTSVDTPDIGDLSGPPAVVVGAPQESLPTKSGKKKQRQGASNRPHNYASEEPLIEEPLCEEPLNEEPLNVGAASQRKVGTAPKTGKSKADSPGMGNVLRLIGELREATERNTSEILHRLDQVERSQEELREILKAKGPVTMMTKATASKAPPLDSE